MNEKRDEIYFSARKDKKMFSMIFFFSLIEKFIYFVVKLCDERFSNEKDFL